VFSPHQRLEKKAKLNRAELQQVPHLLQIFWTECSRIRLDVYIVKIGKSSFQGRRRSPNVAPLQWQGCDLLQLPRWINILQHCHGKPNVWLHVLRRCKFVCPVFADDIADRISFSSPSAIIVVSAEECGSQSAQEAGRMNSVPADYAKINTRAKAGATYRQVTALFAHVWPTLRRRVAGRLVLPRPGLRRIWTDIARSIPAHANRSVTPERESH